MSYYKQHARKIDTEKDLQRESVGILRQCGFAVCITSNGKKTSNSKGTPDTFVFIPGRKRWFALEFKTEEGELSKEQQMLFDMGATVVIRSVEDTHQFIKSFA
ncbi:MAG: hypothetical protein EPO24_09340 [Bacteroidetes bacterium]|nr:MAG: hypothetical protein EPO24_09340 [Bacteroidota bacterium]